MIALQTRHLTHLVAAFLFLIFFPFSAAGECDIGSCQTLLGTFKPCGSCDPQPVTQCFPGCDCSYCSRSYGQCNCNNRLYNYETDGLTGTDGDCECGNARVHVRRNASGKAGAATIEVALGVVNGPEVAKETRAVGSVPFAFEEALVIPDRCTHAYRILGPKVSSRLPGGN